MTTALAEMVAEGGDFIVNDISGGATARYVRIYFSSFYRFEDVTELVMAALSLPLVRAHGMHTAAVYGTDAQIAERIRASFAPKPMPPAASPAKPTQEPPAGGRRVKVKALAPTRPPRGGGVALKGTP